MWFARRDGSDQRACLELTEPEGLRERRCVKRGDEARRLLM